MEMPPIYLSDNIRRHRKGESGKYYFILRIESQNIDLELFYRSLILTSTAAKIQSS